jgi:hypothetical protein
LASLQAELPVRANPGGIGPDPGGNAKHHQTPNRYRERSSARSPAEWLHRRARGVDQRRCLVHARECNRSFYRLQMPIA